jgi:hypothetical protein
MQDDKNRRRHGKNRPASWRPAAWLAAATAAFALLATGCGGGSSGAAGSGPTGSAYQQALAWAQCMRTHGSPAFPDPNSQGQFVHDPADAAAMGNAAANTACKKLQPKEAPFTTQQQQQYLATGLKFAACMRSHGYPKFADPVVNAEDMGFLLVYSASVRNSPQYQSTSTTCRSQSGFKP